MMKLCALMALCASFGLGQATTPQGKLSSAVKSPDRSPAYNDLVSSGYDLLKSARIGEAYLAALEAAKKNPSRYESYALAALALHARGSEAEAKPFIEKALQLAPAAKKPLLNDLAHRIESALAAAKGDGNQDPELLRQMDALRLILEDADNAKTASARATLLREFMTKSAAMIENQPSGEGVWLLRAAIAVELDYPLIGWYSARQLTQLQKGENPKTRTVMAWLERKGWLGERENLSSFENKTTAQLRTQAQSGHAEAQFVVGRLEYLGESGHKDPAKAIPWFLRAAEQGHPIAEYMLGKLLLLGEGVPANEAAAALWFRKAALHGQADAQIYLGVSYLRGSGVPQDSREAIRWFHAAEQQPDKSSGLKNGLAWQLATDPDARLREGNEAVELAQAACEATGYRNWGFLDTLAAALAEAGRWAKAIEMQTKAIELFVKTPADDDKEGMQARVRMYQQRRPFRDADATVLWH